MSNQKDQTMTHRTLFIAFMMLLVVPHGNTGIHGLSVGDRAPGFTLKNVDGRMVSLDDFENAKGYLIIFTCNTCPYAKAYEDRIIALHNKYAPKGIPVIAINPNAASVQSGDSFEAMQARARAKRFPFPYVQDERQEVARNFGATKTPHVYLLKRDRTVAYMGAIDNNHRDAAMADRKYVEDAVDALLGGDAIPVEETKAIGCTIKWKDA